MAKVLDIVEESDGFVIVSDCWSNINHQHLVSFIIYVQGSNPFFYKMVDTSQFQMTAEKNAEIIIDVAVELGIAKWLAVVTDNAPVLQTAWKIIESRFPRVFACGCIAHELNSYLSDICKSFDGIQETLHDSKFLIKQVNYHTRINEKFEKTRKRLSVARKLQSPVATRFATEFISGGSVLKNKSTFQTLLDENEELIRDCLSLEKAQRRHRTCSILV